MSAWRGVWRFAALPRADRNSARARRTAYSNGAQEIQKEFESCCQSTDFRIVIQAEPKGMAHAVWQARDSIETPNTVVVWGDQICLRDETISSTLAYHQKTFFPHRNAPLIIIYEIANSSIIDLLLDYFGIKII